MSMSVDAQMASGRARRAVRWTVGLVAALAMTLATASGPAAAPILDVSSIANTTAAPGSTFDYYVSISNVGNEATSSDVTLTATFPTGITANAANDWLARGWDCSTLVVGASTVTCTQINSIDPFLSSSRNALIVLTVDVDPGATGDLTSTFEVSGGGAAASDSVVDTTSITSTLPDFGIDAFDGQVSADPSGTAFTQAGGHPYAISTAIMFNTFTNPIPEKGPTWPIEPTKDVLVDLPPGLVGDPTATGDARCTLDQLANSEGTVAKPLCPPGAQVGETKIYIAGGFINLMIGDPLPVFNMVPPADVPARFGFNVAGTVVTLDAALRSGGDYGLSVNVRDISQGLAIAGTELSFWGVPADPRHDPVRACAGQQAPGEGGPSCKTEQPRRAFLRLPTRCLPPGQGFETTARVDSWDDPGDFRAASFTTHLPPAFPFPPSQWGAIQGTTGCDQVPFEPTFSGAPLDATAGAPSAFAFDLTLPQSDDPDQLGTADLKKAVVTLPLGLRVSPSSAKGLGACSPAQIALGSDAVPTCPGSAKIGTLRIDTPLLDDPLTGAVYLAAPHDNPFDSLLSLYLVAKGPGIVIKLPGKVETDLLTGQMTATFDDNPQLPFSNLHLEFKGGPRAPLVNPAQCGTYTTHAELTSWSGATAASDSNFTISEDGNGTPCGTSQFDPQLDAGVTSVKAGEHTSFSVRLTRTDEDQEISTLGVKTPTGLLAKVAGVPLCADAQAAAGTCGEGSRIGDVLTGSGAGSRPFYLPGRVYLTDPYKGGPFGLSIVVPAIAGPFNLGNVVVRASIQVDKHTAQLRVVSDPLPTILEGITLQIRDVRVTIDRDDFMINPTSCLQKRVVASVTSTSGAQAAPDTRFQVGGCSRLKLAPRLSLTVGSKGHTRASGTTPLVAKLTQTPGQANLKSVGVTLPLTINAVLDTVENACTIAEYEAGNCESARTGTAVAVTPLLDDPLKGSVYFVKNKTGKGLPNLVVALRGQVDFDLVGKIEIPGGKALATKFNTVPDVPITSFTLRMEAGSHGAVGTARNLCTKKSRQAKAAIVFRGQNGAVIRKSQRLHVRGCPAK
jgi:hypothetical protein